MDTWFKDLSYSYQVMLSLNAEPEEISVQYPTLQTDIFSYLYQ